MFQRCTGNSHTDHIAKTTIESINVTITDSRAIQTRIGGNPIVIQQLFEFLADKLRVGLSSIVQLSLFCNTLCLQHGGQTRHISVQQVK